MTETPKKLNLGSGKSFREDYINVDLETVVRPDFVHDMSLPFPFDHTFTTDRFGEISIARESLTDILADNVLEHIVDLPTTMTNCLNLLAVDGIMEIVVPYDLSYGAWQDPTHVRAFNDRSWLYYTDWCWYLNWKEFRFDIVSNIFLLSTYGLELMNLYGQNVEVVARFPRAVDFLHVKLKKRAITQSERDGFSVFRR
jgi:hypothetical protein